MNISYTTHIQFYYIFYKAKYQLLINDNIFINIILIIHFFFMIKLLIF